MILSPRDNNAPSYGVASAYQLRPAGSRRVARVRVAWFVLGTVFGVMLGTGVASYMGREHVATAQSAEVPANPIAAAPVEASPEAESPVVTAPAAALEPEPAPAAEPEMALPGMFSFKVRKGDTLASILADKGVTQEEAQAAVDVLKKYLNPKRFNKGQTVTVALAHNPELQDKTTLLGFSLEESPLRTITLNLTSEGRFVAKEINAPTYKSLAHAGGTIRTSLYQTAIDSGIPVKMVGEIIQAFSYDVDFQRDIKRGDKLDVVFEHTHTDKNVTTGIGKMMYASLVLDDKTLTIYRHTSTDGFTGYYTAKGESVRKALLKTPINGAHVTSNFGMRKHPLLGYSKMHKGIDFGAPTGTPIYAAGDGVIESAGRKGGYGNYVLLRHNKDYATAYGHASRIAKGIRAGSRVKQGQVIAYVGSTGASTGPHLHYEILRGGTQINPSGVKFRTGQTLAGKEFLAFKKQVKQVEAVLAQAPQKIQVASIK